LVVAPLDQRKVELGSLEVTLIRTVLPWQTWVLLALILTTGAWAQK